MKILFITRLYAPHIGGVEKQVGELSKRLKKKGHDVTVLTEKFRWNLKSEEIIKGVKVVRISYRKIKYIGLLNIWLEIIKHKKLLLDADIIHTHSAFVWFLPFRFIFPRKRIYSTFHGWEGIYPIPYKNILLRRVAARLTSGYFCIGKFIEKHYGINADNVYYTAVEIPKNNSCTKNQRMLLYVGRLDEDTGLSIILECLKYLADYEIVFCGDGVLASKCAKFGKVCGFTDPRPYYKKAAICLSAGHTSILEAFANKCLVITTYNNPVKQDYLKMTPFKRYMIVRKSPKNMAKEIEYYFNNPEERNVLTKEAYGWVQSQNWQNITKKHLKLWGIK